MVSELAVVMVLPWEKEVVILLSHGVESGDATGLVMVYCALAVGVRHPEGQLVESFGLALLAQHGRVCWGEWVARNVWSW